ncbi:MAG: multidrug effflux MFS transporter [Paracoccaceae bacterium]|nr:multidrug effflux MFS transporter [Paracoccaceae bacterium]
MTASADQGGKRHRLSRGEFVAMIAVLFATVAFSIDAMLPAFPEIATEFSPDVPNRAQLVIAAFLLGLGLGIFVVGPVSDAFGRKATIVGAIALYVLGAIIAASAASLEALLAARVIQGLGAAGPRVVALALVRDLYAGRQMAQIVSFVMMVFVMIPSVAPLIGTAIIAGFGWRGIFWAFVVFGLIGATWLTVRQEETLPPERRRPLNPAALGAALREIVAHPMVRLYILVMTLGFGQMFALIASIQQVYYDVYGIVQGFPWWFAFGGAIAIGGTVLNATLVMRLGMRRLATAAYAVQTVLSGLLAVATLAGLLPPALAFPAFFVWSTSIFFIAGMTFGNLNALALQPMGHIAGTAASVVGALSTVGSVLIAIPIGLAFNGTVVPLAVGAFLCSAAAWWLMGLSREEGPDAQPVHARGG